MNARSSRPSLARWLLALLVALIPARAGAAYVVGDDLPGPSAHVRTMPSGSLVIPMDNSLQALVAPFNVRSYGLVNDLLHNGIPVMWAIRAGKAKDGIDFTANASRIAPSAIASASVNFAGGPFLVHRDFAALAAIRIAAFGGNVAVYQLSADTSIDVRYDVLHIPTIAVSNVNTALHTNVMDAAGIPNYTVVDPTTLSAASCYTNHSEPHTNVAAGIPNVKAYVQSGGNFLGQCAAVETFENPAGGRFQTTLGIVNQSDTNTLAYPNPDLAYSQFVGALNPDPSGSVRDWYLAVGSAFQNNAHVHAQSGASPVHYAAAASKLYNGAGGNFYYLGGHNFSGSAALGDVNGERMYLNILFIPTTRPAACNLFIILRTISGTVYEDVNGDGGLGDAVARPNVSVRLYADVNNNGLVDAGDTYLSQASTDASGAYSFLVSTNATGNRYLVAVDSRSITPSAGLNGGAAQGDVWAEQTYGDDSTTAAIDLATRFGGRTPATSDNFAVSTTPASNNYQHLARVDVTSADVAGLNFAFSFNVMTHTRSGDAADDDLSANRTVQGSLRQFLQNANAVAAANAMRFVPAVATNASGGGGNWWRVDVTTSLPAVTDVDTTIDGRAYSTTNGTTVRDDNPGVFGAGGTVGVDALALATVARPELEIRNLRATAVVNIGLDLAADRAAVRRVAVLAFGNVPDNDGHADIRVGAAAASAIVEDSYLGIAASSFADPGVAFRSGGDGLRAIGGDNGSMRNSLIGFCAGAGVSLNGSSNGWLVEGNEIRGSAVAFGHLGGVLLEGASTTATLRGNLIVAGTGAGIDTPGTGGSHTIVNNTISGNGVGLDPDAAAAAVVTPGIRLFGSGSAVDRNVITANFGAGAIVPSGATGNRITRNSIFANGTILNTGGNGPSLQVGIDLLRAADNQTRGTAPYFTINDAGDGDAGGNTLLNFPVLVDAIDYGSTLTVSGFARPGATVEFFIADADPSGFGEGRTYLFSAAEGSGADLDAGTGTYGPAAVQGIVQGTDTTNRFAFTVALPPGVTVGTQLTATATDASSSTSEFSGLATVARPTIVKRAFLANGSPLADGAVLPRGTLVKFLLYVNNIGDAVPDVSASDVLDPAFAYVGGTIKTANTVARCADLACTLAEEAAIFAAADVGVAGTDGADSDAVSFSPATVYAGNQLVANAQLNLAAARVWALVFTVRVQ